MYNQFDNNSNLIIDTVKEFLEKYKKRASLKIEKSYMHSCTIEIEGYKFCFAVGQTIMSDSANNTNWNLFIRLEKKQNIFFDTSLFLESEFAKDLKIDVYKQSLTIKLFSKNPILDSEFLKTMYNVMESVHAVYHPC